MCHSTEPDINSIFQCNFSNLRSWISLDRFFREIRIIWNIFTFLGLIFWQEAPIWFAISSGTGTLFSKQAGVVPPACFEESVRNFRSVLVQTWVPSEEYKYYSYFQKDSSLFRQKLTILAAMPNFDSHILEICQTCQTQKKRSKPWTTFAAHLAINLSNLTTFDKCW